MQLTIVLPAKNESSVIESVIREIKSLLPAVEIIVVDDGSTDATASKALGAGATVVSHPYCKGNGAAVKTGAKTAQGEIIVFMDADGQHHPKDIEAMLLLMKNGYDMVVGARQKGSQANIWRGMANKTYNFLATWMTGHKVEDLTSGFRAVKAERFREFLHLLPNGFSYPTTSTMAFFRAGYSVGYVPIHAAKRVGKSHINLFKDGVRFFLIIFKIGTLFSPLKIFFPVASAMLMLASAWYGWTWWHQGRFTNMSALLYTGGVMVFLMGLISEQITVLMYKDSGSKI